MPQTPASSREQRRITLDDVEVRADATGGDIHVDGHAAVWEKPAWIGPPKYGFSERFLRGAFKETINGGADVRYLFNHNPDHVLARTKNGSLRLREDASGLRIDAELAPTTVGRDLGILLGRGIVNQMSVGMQVLEDRWDEVHGSDGNLYEQRTIIRAKLFDVSAVTYPAYEDTDAGLREADLARELRDARGVAVRRSQPDGDGAAAPDVVAPVRPAGPQEPTSEAVSPQAASQTPPAQGGEQSGPATATPHPEESRTTSDVVLLNEHAFTDEHRKIPRLMCPACNPAGNRHRSA